MAYSRYIKRRRRLLVSPKTALKPLKKPLQAIKKGAKGVGDTLRVITPIAETLGLNVEILKKGAAIADAMDMPLHEGIQFLSDAEQGNQIPRNKAPSSSFAGAGSLGTSYLTAEMDVVKVSGKGSPLKSTELNRHRQVFQNAGSSTGVVYGKAHWQALALESNLSHFTTQTTNLFGADATQRYKFQLSNLTTQLQFHNIDRVTCYLDFYVVVPTVDTDTTLLQALDDGAAAARYTTSTGTASKEDLDFSIHNTYTRKLWSVLSEKHYKMEPGHTLKLVTQLDGFFPISETRLAGSSTHIKGQSVHYAWRLVSAPIRDSADGAVSLGTPDIIFTALTVQNWAGHTVKSFSRTELNEFDSSITNQNVRMKNAQGVAAGDLNGDATPDDNDTAT